MVFLTHEQASELSEMLNAMDEAYRDEGRSDWFDADDLARDIAYKVKAIIDGFDRPSGRCPVCGGYATYGDVIDVNDGIATQGCNCAEGHTWTDIYELVESIPTSEGE